MAIAVHESLNNANTSTFIIFNTGSFSPNLSVGDLMIAQYFVGATSFSVTMPSGWTMINQTENPGDAGTSHLSYKVADASDVAGQAIQWAHNVGAGRVQILHVTRITGHRATSTITTSSGTSADGVTTITATSVTPTEAESLILFYTAADQNRSVSGHTIATSAPTFTEQYDLIQSGYGVSMASGVRTAITATGAGTATASGTTNCVAQLVVVSAPLNVSLSDTATITDSISVLRTLLVTISETVTGTDLVTPVVNKIFNLAKNVSTWINGDKN